MYLKSKWRNIGIKNKMFIISTTLVLVTSIVIYTGLFIIFPKIFLGLKDNGIKKSTDEVVRKLEEDNDIDYGELLDKYAYDNGGVVSIITKYGEGVYYSNKYMMEPRNIEVKKEPFMRGGPNREKDNLMVTRNFYFKSIGKYCTLTIHVPVGFISDINRVMIRLLPMIIIITIVIGVLSAYIYSIVINKPLLRINDIAGKISKLDFSEKLNYVGNDEISQLSKSMNLISNNLEDTINSLEYANKSLLSDIEKERLQDKRRREFLKAISHELKTPITVISGQIEGMLYNIGPYKDRDKYLRESLESVEELKKLTEEIVNLSKYEEGIELEYKNFVLNDLVHEVIDGYEYFIDKNNLKVDIYEECSLAIRGDVNIIRKVISNIIGNSLKYSLNNKDIKINIYESGKVQIINYTNSIDENEKDFLFKAFYRLDKSRSKETGGTGLGLYIVKTLLDMHKNIDYYIDLENNKFIFNLKFNKEI